MGTPKPHITSDELLNLPIPGELSGFELVNGQLVPVTPASKEHGRLTGLVSYFLIAYIESSALGGEVILDGGVVLGLAHDPDRVRGPDVAYLTDRQLKEHGDPGEHFARFAPALAVEIDLNSGRKPGGRQRIAEYIEAGVELVWSIDPRKRRATVHRRDGTTTILTEADALDGEHVLPGFRLELARLFKSKH
jgi:Uma2 family endonuclease